jgi:hypothetical protein
LDTYSGNAENNAIPESITISSGLNSEPDKLKLITAEESGSNQFYIGWRINNALHFAKFIADGTSPPAVVIKTKTSDIISGLGNPLTTGGWGRASYSIAAGQTNDANPIDIVGVLYSASSPNANGELKCKFRAYKVDANELVKVSSSDSDIDFQFPSNDCRFPHLFWNKNSKKFLAVWVEGKLPAQTPYNFGPTYYSEFRYKSDGSLSNSKQLVITDSRTSTTNKLVCNMGASYSPAIAGTYSPRIAIVTIESSACKQQTAEMKLDFYKPGN